MCRKAVNQSIRLMAAIFDFQHAQALDSILSSLSVLPDPGNMVVVVGIVLLSCMRAETYVISYLLPVIDRHLLFMTYSDIEHHH